MLSTSETTAFALRIRHLPTALSSLHERPPRTARGTSTPHPGRLSLISINLEKMHILTWLGYRLQDLVSAYENLYSATCSVCGTVLSREGGFSPLERMWQALPQGVGEKRPEVGGGSGEKDVQEKPSGCWVARHIGCR